MKCIYCKKESEDKICYECLSEMNNILNYNEKCEHLNNVYGTFGLIRFFAFVALFSVIFSFIREIIFLNFNFSFYLITTLLLLFTLTIVVSSKFRSKYNKKIEKVINNEMNRRHKGSPVST